MRCYSACSQKTLNISQKIGMIVLLQYLANPLSPRENCFDLDVPKFEPICSNRSNRIEYLLGHHINSRTPSFYRFNCGAYTGKDI